MCVISAQAIAVVVISSCLHFCKGSLAVPVQAIASLADYEPDNLPQPIRMSLSGLQRLSQAQLWV